jgi:hypothetical protein
VEVFEFLKAMTMQSTAFCYNGLGFGKKADVSEEYITSTFWLDE